MWKDAARLRIHRHHLLRRRHAVRFCAGESRSHPGADEKTFPVRDDVQVFFEANPEDVTPVSVRAWRDLGVVSCPSESNRSMTTH